MNDPSSIRTNPLSSKSALPPFQIRGLQQVLFHKDAFVQNQSRPKSSHALLQQSPQPSLRPKTSYHRKSYPLSIEAASALNADSSTSEKEKRREATRRRSSLGDRNVQVLRAINDVLMKQVDSLGQQLKETSDSLRERQLDLSYLSEAELLAKDEIAELRQQLRENEEIIQAKDEVIRAREEIVRLKDELIKQKDARIAEEARALKERGREIEQAQKDLERRERILNRERQIQPNIPPLRTSISRFKEENSISLPDDQMETPDSELDLTTSKRTLSKQSSLTKGKHAFIEMLREQREARSRKAAMRANTRANKVEAKGPEQERVFGSEEAQSTSSSSDASKRPNDENADQDPDRAHGDGFRPKSFIRLKSLVGGRRPRIKSRDFSITGSEGSNYS